MNGKNYRIIKMEIIDFFPHHLNIINFTLIVKCITLYTHMKSGSSEFYLQAFTRKSSLFVYIFYFYDDDDDDDDDDGDGDDDSLQCNKHLTSHQFVNPHH